MDLQNTRYCYLNFCISFDIDNVWLNNYIGIGGDSTTINLDRSCNFFKILFLLSGGCIWSFFCQIRASHDRRAMRNQMNKKTIFWKITRYIQICRHGVNSHPYGKRLLSETCPNSFRDSLHDISVIFSVISSAISSVIFSVILRDFYKNHQKSHIENHGENHEENHGEHGITEKITEGIAEEITEKITEANPGDYLHVSPVTAQNCFLRSIKSSSKNGRNFSAHTGSVSMFDRGEIRTKSKRPVTFDWRGLESSSFEHSNRENLSFQMLKTRALKTSSFCWAHKPFRALIALPYEKCALIALVDKKLFCEWNEQKFGNFGLILKKIGTKLLNTVRKSKNVWKNIKK